MVIFNSVGLFYIYEDGRQPLYLGDPFIFTLWLIGISFATHANRYILTDLYFWTFIFVYIYIDIAFGQYLTYTQL